MIAEACTKQCLQRTAAISDTHGSLRHRSDHL